MTTLLICIHQPDESNTSDAIIPNICAFLGTYGEQATITSKERLRHMAGRKDTMSTTLLRVALAGTARIDLVQLVVKLERFLRSTAKDADIAATFEIFRVDSEE